MNLNDVDDGAEDKVKPLLRAEDVARRLGVSALTVYSWVSRGRIAHLKVGRQVRFDPDAVESMIRRVEPREQE